jgi:hypothetical protein
LGIFSIISCTLMPLHTPVLIIFRLLDRSTPAGSGPPGQD